MAIPHMRNHLCFLAKPRATVLAREGLLSCVQSHMCVQVTLNVEALAAFLTFERAFSGSASVATVMRGGDVLLETGCRHEAFAAHSTLEASVCIAVR